jgi:hypothetical protein
MIDAVSMITAIGTTMIVSLEHRTSRQCCMSSIWDFYDIAQANDRRCAHCKSFGTKLFIAFFNDVGFVGKH